MTNEVVLLSALSSGATIKSDFQPQNNKQAYLAYLNGLNISLPEPRTAEEVLLFNLCVNGGVGGASFTIDDASYLFYNSARYEVKDNLIPLIKNMKTAKAMFYNCMKLTKAPVLDWSSCTDADNAFYGCANMAGEIDFGGAKLQKVNSMFFNCTSLKGILNFAISSTGAFSISGSFPKGTSLSAPAALKRFTFAPNNTFTAMAGLDFSYCSFEREGAVEMFNSLKTVSNPGGNYNQITLIGNPCVTGKAIFHSGSYVTVNSRAEAEALFDGVPLDAEVTMKINNDSPKAYPSLEDAFMNFERAEFPLMLSWDVITYTVDTLTAEDRAIAGNKGWTLVE